MALQAAQVAYDEVAWRTDVAMLAESWQWQAATNNYTVVIALVEPPDELRWGMSVEVTIAAGD